MSRCLALATKLMMHIIAISEIGKVTGLKNHKGSAGLFQPRSVGCLVEPLKLSEKTALFLTIILMSTLNSLL